MIKEQTLCAAFVKIGRGLFEERVDSEFELEFFEL
jgi:hypothetical protein